jgi:hypothetical protein
MMNHPTAAFLSDSEPLALVYPKNRLASPQYLLKFYLLTVKKPDTLMRFFF